MVTGTDSAPVSGLEGRRRLRFTPAEYWSLQEQGIVPERSEFINGEIIEMPPQHWPAVAAIGAVQQALKRVWHNPLLVGSNATHVFASGWHPMPDVVVYDQLPPRRPGPDVTYPVPRLVVEVSDETLDYDLGEKAARYATERLPEYWVADVTGRCMHVFRETDGSDWRERRLYKVGDSLSPLCLPEANLAVAELLPDLYGPGAGSTDV